MNLVYQFYVPFAKNNPHKVGYDGEWIKHGVLQGLDYAKRIGANYALCQKRFMNKDIPVELETVRVWQDPYFDKYDNILIADIDMIFNTDENIFDHVKGYDIAMVHEKDFRLHRSCKWTQDRMSLILNNMGYRQPMPKSILYPEDPFRFLNGGIQVWSWQGRQKARKLFTDVRDYRFKHQGTKEQMYINCNLIKNEDEFRIKELPAEWNQMTMNWTLDNWSENKIIHCGGAEGKPRMMEIISEIRN